MSKFNGFLKLTKDQFDILKETGSITINKHIFNYDPKNTLYITSEGSQSNYVRKDVTYTLDNLIQKTQLENNGIKFDIVSSKEVNGVIDSKSLSITNDGIFYADIDTNLIRPVINGEQIAYLSDLGSIEISIDNETITKNNSQQVQSVALKANDGSVITAEQLLELYNNRPTIKIITGEV